MEYPLNIYITAHTLIRSLGFGIPENLEAIHNYRSGIRMQEAGLISDHPLLAGMIDSVELEKRAKLMQITDYTRMEQLFLNREPTCRSRIVPCYYLPLKEI